MNIVYRKRIVEIISTKEQIVNLITDKNFKKLIPLTEKRIQQIIDGPDLSKSKLTLEVKKLFKYDSGTGMMNLLYWTNRGHSKEEAIIKRKMITNKGATSWKKKYDNGKIIASGSREYLQNKGISEEEIDRRFSEEGKNRNKKLAQAKLKNPEKYKDIQQNQIGYWTKQGLSLDEARLKVKKRQTTFSLEICIAKHGEEKGLDIFNERQEKYKENFNLNSRKEIEEKKKKTRIERGIQIPDKMLSDKELYYKEVRKVTESNRKLVPNINKIARSGIENAHHLDHKYSRKQGFINNIPPYIIGHLENLEVIDAVDNCSKQDNCSISLDALLSKILL